MCPAGASPTVPRPSLAQTGHDLSIYGQSAAPALTHVSPRARPGASLRLFEVSLRALICLPLAACFTRQFLVDSLLTASLQPRPRRQRRFPGEQAGCGQRGQAGRSPGAHPTIPPGAGIPLPGGETWLSPTGLTQSAALWAAPLFWVQRRALGHATGAAVLPCALLCPAGQRGSMLCPYKKLSGAGFGTLDVSWCSGGPPRALQEHCQVGALCPRGLF